MRKLILLVTAIVLFFVKVDCQTVKWSQPLQENKRLPFMQILGEEADGNFYVLRSNMSLESDIGQSSYKNRSYLLQYFSLDLSLLWEKNILTSYEDGHITDIKLVDGMIVVSSFIFDKKAKVNYFYVQYLGNSGKWIGSPVLLDNLPAINVDSDNRPELFICRNQSLMAFTYRKLYSEQKTQSFVVVVIDTSLSVKYRREIEIPYAKQFFNPHNIILTDFGSTFILGTHFLTDKKVKTPDQYTYELYGYNFLHDKVINATINCENKFLTDVGLIADNINHTIIAGGFYSDKTTYSVAGVFYYALTEDGLSETKAINMPFSETYLLKFLGEKKESKELVNYSIDRLIVRKDGGIAFIAESVYETTRSYFDNYMQTFISHSYYHYGNILVVSVNPDGNILWNNIVTKDQNSVDDEGFFSSYVSAITAGRLATIYNKYIDENSSVLVTYTDSKGVQKTEVLINEYEKVHVLPRAAKQIDENTVLLPAFKQNKFFLLRVSF